MSNHESPTDGGEPRELSMRDGTFFVYLTLASAPIVIVGLLLSPLAGKAGVSGKMVGAISMFLLAVVFAAAGIRKLRGYWARLRNPNVRPNDLSRLWCVGSPVQIERHGLFVDAGFEPKIFLAVLAQEFDRRMVVVQFAVGIPAMFVLNLLHTGTWFGDLLRGGVLKMWGGFSIGLFVGFWLWPTYFRVVPGRLDVIRFSTLRNRTMKATHVDLRTAKILADLSRSRLFIDASRGTHEFNMRFVPGKTRLAHALFWAALTTHDPPPLPDDRLLG